MKALAAVDTKLMALKDLRLRSSAPLLPFTAEGGLSKKAGLAWHHQLSDRRAWTLLAGLLALVVLRSIATGALSTGGLFTGEDRSET